MQHQVLLDLGQTLLFPVLLFAQPRYIWAILVILQCPGTAGTPGRLTYPRCGCRRRRPRCRSCCWARPRSPRRSACRGGSRSPRRGEAWGQGRWSSGHSCPLGSANTATVRNGALLSSQDWGSALLTLGAAGVKRTQHRLRHGLGIGGTWTLLPHRAAAQHCQLLMWGRDQSRQLQALLWVRGMPAASHGLHKGR